MSYYILRFPSRGMSTNIPVELPNEQYSKAELIEAIVSQRGEFLVSQGISRTRLEIISGGRIVEDGFCPDPDNWALNCMFKKDLDEDMGIIRNGSISMAARINAFGRIAYEFCRLSGPDKLKDPSLLEVIDAFSLENGYSFAFDLAQEKNAEGFNYWVGTHGGIELIGTRMSMAPENITTFLIRRETEARGSSMPDLTSYSNPILNSLLSVQAIHTSLTTGAALTFDVPNSETDFRQKALFEFSQFFKGPSFTAIASSLPERPRLMEASIPFLKKFPNISLEEIQAFGIYLMNFEAPKRYTSDLDMELDLKICGIGWIINKLQLPAVTASASGAASAAGGPSATEISSDSNPYADSLSAIQTSMRMDAVLVAKILDSTTDFRQNALFELSFLFKEDKLFKALSREKPDLQAKIEGFLTIFPNVDAQQTKNLGEALSNFKACMDIGINIAMFQAVPSSAMVFGPGPSGAGGPSADTAVLGARRD